MKIFRNRTVVGVLCILLALIICFGVTPLFSRSASEKTEIVRVTKDIKEGDEITAEMVQTVEVGAYNLPQNLMTDKKEVVGKYATADLAAGDYILSSKLSTVPAAENAYLYNLDGKKQAISVTIKSFATGLSGKLESGDKSEKGGKSMNDKTKRIILITACCLLCGVAVIGIAGRFGGNTVTPSGTVSGSQPDSNDPNVNINNQGDANVPSLTPEQSDPGQGANSNGTEQTIQADPVKPDAPEKPESPSGAATLPDDHKAEDVPNSERKTEDEPHPTYPEQPTSKPAESQPAAGSTNSSGQVYVPGFGYVDSSGDNTVIDGQDIYENGNKIGEMGGGN